MNETPSPQLRLHVGKAQELVERGKQKQALQELWFAEAQARGDGAAIRELINFTTQFEERIEPKRKPRLAELVAALEHDAKVATRSLVASHAVTQCAQTGRSGAAFYLGLALSVVLAAGASGLILLFWVFQMSDPCSCSGQDFCFFGNPATGGVDAHLAGAGWGLGLLFGGVGFLILATYLVVRFRLPFMSLIVGYPVFYGGLLASTWAVARGVWGPTRC